MRSEVRVLDLSAGPSGLVHLLDAELQEGRSQLVEVTVFDSTGFPMKDIPLRILMGNKSLAEARTDQVGVAMLSVEWLESDSFAVVVQHPGYEEERISLTHGYTSAAKHVRIDLRAAASASRWKMIYHATNQLTIPSFSNSELSTLADFRSACPSGWIEIRSYTDAIGRSRYNQRLSERRANAIKKHLMHALNIPSKAIASKGFGERFLLNECDDHHPCDAERHAQNRRSEILLVRGTTQLPR
jgi:outer membrane protein OmpA-like peptidoglycan-associated protein